MKKWYERSSIPESSWYNEEEPPGLDTVDWIYIIGLCLLPLLIISNILG